MPIAANVNFKVTSDIIFPSTPLSGVSFVLLETERGPIADPKDLITSWAHFQKIFGGLKSNPKGTHLAKEILESGGILRVCRLGHYTDPTDAATLSAAKAVLQNKYLLTFDADLIIGNTIDLDIDGVAIGQVAFNTDNDTTMADLATALAAHANVSVAAIVTPAAGNVRSIIITPTTTKSVLVIDAITVASGASQAGGTASAISGIPVNAGTNPVFTAAMKYEGAFYNDIQILIVASSNGDPDAFDMHIQNTADSSFNETYTNLKIDGANSVNGLTFLKTPIESSDLLDFGYLDLSGFTAPVRPSNGTYLFNEGSDGDAIVSADVVGDSAARTGLHAFDTYDEAYQMAYLDGYTQSVSVAGAAYAANRKDLVFYTHLSNTYKTATTLKAERTATSIDTPYHAFFGGGVKGFNPLTSAKEDQDALGTIIGLAVQSDDLIGPWASFAGPNRGIVSGKTGVVNNFGSKASYADLNILANAQINMVINRAGRTMLWGNFTSQIKADPLSYLSILRFILYFKRRISPIVENFLEEPADFITLGDVAEAVSPVLQEALDNRAVSFIDWVGDQGVTSYNDFQVNNQSDFLQGKLKAKLRFTPINSVQEFEVNLNLTADGVS